MITGNLLLNGSVQKRHKRRFGLKIQISLNLFSSGLLTDYHARNKGLQLFCDLKAWIWKSSVIRTHQWWISDCFLSKLKAKQKTSTKYQFLLFLTNSYDRQTWGISWTIEFSFWDSFPPTASSHTFLLLYTELAHYTSLWKNFFFLCKTPWVPLSYTRAHGQLFPFWFH